MFRSLIATAVLASLCLAFTIPGAAQNDDRADCELGERYYALAHDRIEAYDEEEAARYLERAASACPRYEFFEELGELRMTAIDERERRLAVDAFVRAHALADSEEERARALWKYAALLNQAGDPQNADRLVREARRLDSDNEQIAALAAEIRRQVENPTREQLVRGLSDSLYKPLTVAASPGASASGEAGRPADSTPSISIPIHFEVDSVRLDSKTRQNVEVLAGTLTDEAFEGRGFRFVGHADVRGDAQHNMELSEDRAGAVRDAVVELEPSLEGRITVTGRGEEMPLALGDTDEAHRANRRLQVLVE